MFKTKTFPFKKFGKTRNLCFGLSQYSYNGNLAIEAYDADNGEPYASVTVNLGLLLPEFAFIDVNNFPEIKEILESLGIAKYAGATRCSGYCKYPLYQFEMDKLKEYSVIL